MFEEVHTYTHANMPVNVKNTWRGTGDAKDAGSQMKGCKSPKAQRGTGKRKAKAAKSRIDQRKAAKAKTPLAGEELGMQKIRKAKKPPKAAYTTKPRSQKTKKPRSQKRKKTEKPKTNYFLIQHQWAEGRASSSINKQRNPRGDHAKQVF